MAKQSGKRSISQHNLSCWHDFALNRINGDFSSSDNHFYDDYLSQVSTEDQLLSHTDEVSKHEQQLPNGLTARIFVPEGVSPELECSFKNSLAASTPAPVTLEQAKLQAESKQAAEKLEREL